MSFKFFISMAVVVLATFIVLVQFLPWSIQAPLIVAALLPCLCAHVYEYYSKTNSVGWTILEFFKELLFGW